jgi:hypothetical protein
MEDIAKKFHVLSLMASLNLKFGRAQCYDISCNEKNHKYFVKGNVQLTQRIASKFSSQLCSNDYDRVAILTLPTDTSNNTALAGLV